MIEIKKQKKKNIYLYQTSVDNMFINDMLPIAKGEYVKVYLYGLMYSEQGGELNQRKLAAILRMSEEEVDAAWKYWEQAGVVKLNFDAEKNGGRDYSIEFISQIEKLFSAKSHVNNSEKEHANESPGENEAEKESDTRQNMAEVLKQLYDQIEENSGILLSPKQMDKVAEAISIYEINPKVYFFAIKYCADRDHHDVSYITKVAMSWKKEGLESPTEVKEYISKNDERFYNYKRIFKEMGFSRQVTAADKEMMSKWFDVYNFSLKEILDACRKCAGMREPNLRYVNKIIENMYEKQGGNLETSREGKKKVTRRVLAEYLAELRKEEINENNSRHREVAKNISVWNDVKKLEIEIKQAMMSFDFTEEGKKNRKINRDKQIKLEERKKHILKSNGYPENYLNISYKCDKCKDTGVTSDGRVCTCINDRMEEAYLWNQRRMKQK